MKNLLVVVFLATILFSCNKKTTDGYVISGTIDSVEDGENVYIEIQNETGGLVAIDTAVVENGKFKLTGKAEQIEMAYLQIGSLSEKIPFVLENQNIKVTAYKDSLNASKFEGSPHMDDFTKFTSDFEKQQAKIQKFQEENFEAMQKARSENDNVTIKRISEEYMAIENEIKAHIKNYVSENPKSFVSLMLLSQLISDVDDFEVVKTGFEALPEELKTTKIGKDLEEKIKKHSATSVGQIAPDFSAPNPDGQMVSLKESLGKVTLIDFWASWCGPCRIENPNIVALYDEFHQKGLNIIGVSLDRDGQKDKWLEAIATDKLTWTQVSNLKFWQDPIATQYNVQSIPATFLLDQDGRIIAKNLRGSELRAKVEEFLGAE